MRPGYRLARWRKRAYVLFSVVFLLSVCASHAQDVSRTVNDAATESAALETKGDCQAIAYKDAGYVVCRFDPRKSDIRLFLYSAGGEPYGHFNWLNKALVEKGERLAFAMNAGMYHKDRSPVGLYIETGEELSSASTNDGPGNFHMKPNGVFFVTDAGAVGVQETAAFLSMDREIDFATQSGPMLVIDGNIHPRFLHDSNSLKRRNGVGIAETGEAVFVLSDAPVRFYDFALFFRDELKAHNALYLDGAISRLYAPQLDRNDPGVAMGPIVGVVGSE